MPISKKRLAILAPLVAVAGLIMPTAAQAVPHYYENGVKLPEEAGPPEKENVAGAHPVIEWGHATLESGIYGPIACIEELYASIWNPTGGGPGRSKVTTWGASECKGPHLEELTGITSLYIGPTSEFPLKGTTGAVAEASMAGQRRGVSLPWKGELCGPVENRLSESSHFILRTGLIAYGEAGDAIEGANCLHEATPVPTACYPHATGPEPERKWQDIVEPEGANTAAGVLVHGKGCIMLNFVIPQVIAEGVFFGTSEAEIQAGGANALTPGTLKFHQSSKEGIPSGELESQERGLNRGATIAPEGIKLIGADDQQQVEVKDSAPPTVGTDGVEVTGPTTARVVGNADANGESTTVHADYALASEPWCASGGTQGTPKQTAAESIGSSNAEISELVVGLEGLTPASEYCVELVAASEGGTAYGGQRRFTTPAA